MIRLRRFSSRNESRFARDGGRALQRLLLSLTGIGLLVLSSIMPRAHAQFTTNGGTDHIELGIHNEPYRDSFALRPEVIDYESQDSAALWTHPAGHCCGGCAPGWRVRLETLQLNFEANSGITLSNEFFLGDPGYEVGAKLSLIRHLDCLDAWELAYIGPYEWEEFGQVSGVNLTSRLFSPTVNVSEFNNATSHSQSFRSTLNSLEVNRRSFGWDVISTLYGLRYISVYESYLFNSTGSTGTGSLSIDTNNHMVGPQIGLELMFPLQNWTTTTSFKGVLMANSANGNFQLVNAGTTEISNSDDNLELAALIQFGYHLSYQVTPRVKVRGGYEFWWLYGFAAVTDQLTLPLSTATGSHLEDGDAYYHGVSGGIEVVW